MIVATGHYHAPKVPNIPGLKEWKKAYPSRIQHSKRYRSARGYEDKVCCPLSHIGTSTNIST